MSTIKDYVQLHFIVLLWGFTAILGLYISIPAVELVFYRTLFSFLLLGILLVFWKIPFNIGKVNIGKYIFSGFLVSAHWILFFASARISTASVCLAGLATCALWTSLIEPLLNKKAFKKREILLGSIVVIDLYIIFKFEFNHAWGLILAIISAFFAAIFTVLNGMYVRVHDHYVINFYEMVGAFISTVLFLPIYQVYFIEGNIDLVLKEWDFLFIGILALVCTVYAYSVSIELMKRISAFSLNLTVNMEPVYGIILAVLIIGEKEKMTGGFYIGTLVILLCVFAYPFLNNLSFTKSGTVKY